MDRPTSGNYVQNGGFSSVERSTQGSCVPRGSCARPNQQGGTASAEQDNRLPSEKGFYVRLNVRAVPCEIAENSPLLATCLKHVGVQTRGIFVDYHKLDISAVNIMRI